MAEAGPLFGGTLDSALLRNADNSIPIPRVCYECIEYLRARALATEGLSRVAASRKEAEMVKQMLEDDDDVPLFRAHNEDRAAHHVVASVVKVSRTGRLRVIHAPHSLARHRAAIPARARRARGPL
jgi:hypothetical protein